MNARGELTPGSSTAQALIVTVGARAYAIPIRHVSETMRPLPIEPVPGAPAFVRGLSVIRGAPLPVVDLRRLLEGESPVLFGRFVTVQVDERRFVLAVDRVVGVRDLALLQTLPPLLRADGGTDLVQAIGISDAQLLVVLRAARLVPEDVWGSLAIGPGR